MELVPKSKLSMQRPIKVASVALTALTALETLEALPGGPGCGDLFACFSAAAELGRF